MDGVNFNDMKCDQTWNGLYELPHHSFYQQNFTLPSLSPTKINQSNNNYPNDEILPNFKHTTDETNSAISSLMTQSNEQEVYNNLGLLTEEINVETEDDLVSENLTTDSGIECFVSKDSNNDLLNHSSYHSPQSYKFGFPGVSDSMIFPSPQNYCQNNQNSLTLNKFDQNNWEKNEMSFESTNEANSTSVNYMNAPNIVSDSIYYHHSPVPLQTIQPNIMNGFCKNNCSISQNVLTKFPPFIKSISCENFTQSLEYSNLNCTLNKVKETNVFPKTESLLSAQSERTDINNSFYENTNLCENKLSSEKEKVLNQNLFGQSTNMEGEFSGKKRLHKYKQKDIAKQGESYIRNKPLNHRAVSIMENWYKENESNPYPTILQKQIMSDSGGVSRFQVSSWFANRRNRSQNTRPKKNMQKLRSSIVLVCHEVENASNGLVKASDIAYRILSLVEKFLG